MKTRKNQCRIQRANLSPTGLLVIIGAIGTAPQEQREKCPGNTVAQPRGKSWKDKSSQVKLPLIKQVSFHTQRTALYMIQEI